MLRSPSYLCCAPRATTLSTAWLHWERACFPWACPTFLELIESHRCYIHLLAFTLPPTILSATYMDSKRLSISLCCSLLFHMLRRSVRFSKSSALHLLRFSFISATRSCESICISQVNYGPRTRTIHAMFTIDMLKDTTKCANRVVEPLVILWEIISASCIMLPKVDISTYHPRWILMRHRDP